MQAERDKWNQDWKSGNCASFQHSRVSSFLKGIISEKASGRPHRFFGEAYVAAKWDHQEGWYCSYKWLTSRVWTDETNPKDKYRRMFKIALRAQFPELRKLQERAITLAAQLGEKPVPPDLWLIRNNEHWFIESKIPPDEINDAQLAGLALIATCLPSSKPVHVAVVYLQSEFASGHRIPKKIIQRFHQYCERLETMSCGGSK